MIHVYDESCDAYCAASYPGLHLYTLLLLNIYVTLNNFHITFPYTDDCLFTIAFLWYTWNANKVTDAPESGDFC